MSYDDYDERESSRNSSAVRRPGGGSNNPFGEVERPPTEEERIVSQILDVQQESKGSTQRSLALLYQTEEIGTATAEQIVEQGEKLDRIEGTVKKIDADLKQTQKHLNGLKSVFGGVTNWWQARKDKKKGQPDEAPVNDSGLKGALKQQSVQTKQASRSAGNDSSSGYNPSSSSMSTSSPARRPGAPTAGGTSVQNIMEQHEQEIEEDLDEMSTITDRLKFMAVAMGEEMDKQNSQIDRITDHVGRTDMTVSGQNKQMNKILKK